MIRLVLDTNIVVSALLQPLSPPAQVYLLGVDGSIQICISGNVYAEYEEVLRRPRLRFQENVIATTLCTIREKGLGSGLLSPYERVPIRMTTSSLNVRKPPRQPSW